MRKLQQALPNCNISPSVQELDKGRNAAIAAIKKLGGVVDHPVKLVSLTNTQITDAGLEHLKKLTSLDTLLIDHTEVTDAGLEHLKGSTNLRMLSLVDTKVTDAGWSI